MGWDGNHPGSRYDELELPVCERAYRESVWLPHSVLLAGADRMAEIVDAVRERV